MVGESPLLDKSDNRIRMIPITTYRPTLDEIMRIYNVMTNITFEYVNEVKEEIKEEVKEEVKEVKEEVKEEIKKTEIETEKIEEPQVEKEISSIKQDTQKPKPKKKKPKKKKKKNPTNSTPKTESDDDDDSFLDEQVRQMNEIKDQIKFSQLIIYISNTLNISQEELLTKLTSKSSDITVTLESIKAFIDTGMNKNEILEMVDNL